MQVQAIEFKVTDNSTGADIEELIQYFIGALKNNGQILSGWILVKNNGNYMLYATTPKSDSLDKRFDSIYGQRRREELSRVCSFSFSRIGTNADSQEYCSCGKRTAIEMQTFSGDIDSVFTCCDCGKPIALYELPYLDRENEHYWILNWQDVFGSVDELWLDSLSDRFTGNQLVNVNSALNKMGRAIAEAIGKKADLKVYYNIFDDLTKKVKFEKVDGKYLRVCPGCGKTMKFVKFTDDYERAVCDDCSLSSNIPDED